MTGRCGCNCAASLLLPARRSQRAIMLSYHISLRLPYPPTFSARNDPQKQRSEQYQVPHNTVASRTADKHTGDENKRERKDCTLSEVQQTARISVMTWKTAADPPHPARHTSSEVLRQPVALHTMHLHFRTSSRARFLFLYRVNQANPTSTPHNCFDFYKKTTPTAFVSSAVFCL